MLQTTNIGVGVTPQKGELRISPENNRIVIWTRYNYTYRTFTMEYPVLNAVFTNFSYTKTPSDLWAVIVCHDMSVHSFNLETGDLRVIGLQFKPVQVIELQNHGICFVYKRNNKQEISLMDSPESLPRPIVPSSVSQPIECTELKLVNQRYMVAWHSDLKKILVYSIVILPRGDQFSEGSMHSKSALYSFLCEWQQLGSGAVFTQDWNFGEMVVCHDDLDQKMYLYNGQDVFGFQGIAFAQPLLGVAQFPAIAVIGSNGMMHVGFFNSNETESIPVDVEPLKNVAGLHTEGTGNWCVVEFDNKTKMEFTVEFGFEPLLVQILEILSDLLGSDVACACLPVIIAKLQDCENNYLAGMLNFIREFIAASTPKVSSQLIVYLYMLCEELKLGISNDFEYQTLINFIAPYIKHWDWQIEGCDDVEVPALPRILERPPDVFESIINCMNPTEGKMVSAEFLSAPQIFPKSSALIGIFHASATQKSTDRIKEYIVSCGILDHIDSLIPGLKTCLLEMCSFFGINQTKVANSELDFPRPNSLVWALFNNDFRFKECQRLLQVREPQKCLLGVYLDGKNDIDNGTVLDIWNKKLAERALACGYGLSAVELYSRRPMLWEQMEPIKINFEGECTETIITIPACYSSIQDAQKEDPWGVFCHGVALGLSVFPKSPGIDSLWVVSSSRLRKVSSEIYSGFVYGMGLSGHLSSLEDWHFYESLVNTDTSGTIAALLGVAASKRGSSDPKLTKVLAVHIRALLPNGAVYNSGMVSNEIERAALISLGLLYFGQGVRHLSDVLMKELCSIKTKIISRNEEQPMIFNGVKPNTIRSVNTYVDGEGSENNFAHKLAVGISLGLMNSGRADKSGLSKLCDHVQSRFDGSVDSSEIVSGALMALLLAYAGSNDSLVASKITLPQTDHALMYTTPSSVFLKALVKHLIMWDNFEVSAEWVERQIPSVLKDTIKHPSESSAISKLYYYHGLTGVLSALAMRYCGTGNEDVIDILLHYTQDVLLKKYTECLELSVAVRKEVLTEEGRKTYFIEYPLLYTLQCLAKMLSSLALAMAAVASGTGNLKVLRLLREFHQIGPQVQALYDPEIAFTNNVDLSMPQISQAIGWLFLAEGTYSFKTDPQSVSMLACFSFLPLSGGPNIKIKDWEHLYFFWALVTEKRLLFVKGAPESKVRVEIELNNDEIIRTTTPYHLPPISTIKAIYAVDNQYVSSKFTNLDELVLGPNAGLSLVVQKSSGVTKRITIEQEPTLDESVDAWDKVQMDLLKATLDATALNPPTKKDASDIELLLTFYDHWPQKDEVRLLNQNKVEELRVMHWFSQNR